MKTMITTTGSLYRDDYLAESGVTVQDLGNTVAIGGTEHRKEDLVISDGEIESKLSGWRVNWDTSDEPARSFYACSDSESEEITASSIDEAAEKFGIPSAKEIADGAFLVVRDEETYQEKTWGNVPR